MPVVEVITFIAAPPERVFDCVRDVSLHLRSMAPSGERVVSGRSSGLIEKGDTITWRARHFGIPWRMTVRVTALEQPRWIQDKMLRGPFDTFTHDHYIEPSERGTRMHDVIAFRSPLQPVGRVADMLLVRRRVEHILRLRCDAVRAAAEQAVAAV